MIGKSGFLPTLVAAAVTAVAYSGVASAQDVGAGCRLETVAGTAGQVVKCGNGLTVTTEKGTVYALKDRDGNGSVDAVDLKSKGVLLDLPPGAADDFEVVAPQAIAAVRGTRWAVDAAGGKTSVFVIRGSVSVSHVSRRGAVVLGPGDGVDVEAGAGPLTVKRWPPARVAALLARFGQ